jgi:programmed cell death protein 5
MIHFCYRLDRLKLAKKEKAAAVEDSLINAAKSGALKQKVTEDQLIKMLEGITDQDEGEGGKRKIAIQRKKYADDSSDDNDDDLL